MSPIVRIENVHKSFGNFKVLNNINLSVTRGEKVVICGPSGSGKSTLIRCLNGLEGYQGGRIDVDGIHVDDNIRNVSLLRRRVGMVFQQFNLFPHLTVLENCMLAPTVVGNANPGAARKISLALLERVRITDQADKYPSELSGGQQQRAAIARCLAMDPQILLFDEPTSALDPEMVGEVLQVMTELAHDGTTMLCVTHEMSFAHRVADRIVFMEAGSVVHVGGVVEFFGAGAPQRVQAFLGKLTMNEHRDSASPSFA